MQAGYGPAFFLSLKNRTFQQKPPETVTEQNNKKRPDLHSINHKSVEQYKQKVRKLPEPDEIYTCLRNGDTVMLGQAITLVENMHPRNRVKAEELLKLCMPHDGTAIRIGITGVPGVGKSTFIEAFGTYLISQGMKVAVLAIDPTSTRSGGSILGDKTRMENLAASDQAFIRPSPSGATLGGVARKTRETILLCETYGFEVIIVETVGVGQSETAVQSMVDFFLLLMLAGAGDEMQGIKRGIVEMADMIAITKADGHNLEAAKRAVNEYTSALHLYPLPPSGWTPKVTPCSARENSGIKEIWNTIVDYLSFTRNNGYFEAKRAEQALYWFRETLNEGLRNHFFGNPQVQKEIQKLEEQIRKRLKEPFSAATQILRDYFEKRK